MFQHVLNQLLSWSWEESWVVENENVIDVFEPSPYRTSARLRSKNLQQFVNVMHFLQTAEMSISRCERNTRPAWTQRHQKQMIPYFLVNRCILPQWSLVVPAQVNSEVLHANHCTSCELSGSWFLEWNWFVWNLSVEMNASALQTGEVWDKNGHVHYWLKTLLQISGLSELSAGPSSNSITDWKLTV